jgi:Uma2 family endonuclease
MVVLSSNVLPQIRLTVDEYLQADLPEGHRYELVNGVVEMPPAPDMGHADSVDVLYQAICEYGKATPGAFVRVTTRAAVRIPRKETVRDPDVAVYAKWGNRGLGWRGWLQFTPFLVAEVVSPGQSLRDYRDKKADYWRAGIREYWIVDPEREAVTVMTRGRKRWKKTVFARRQHARSTALPGFTVPVAHLVA